MTRNEYERTCYLIGIKPIDISNELLDKITEQQLISLFSNPDNLQDYKNKMMLGEELRKRVKMVKV